MASSECSARSSARDPVVRNSAAFKNRLKDERLARGLTQQDLANKVGVSLTTIQNYEGGQLPRGEHLVSLSDILGVSIDWLLLGTETIPRGEGLSTTKPAGIAKECDTDLVLVPKVRARLSAGGGSLETNAEVKGRYAFKAEWIRSKGKPGQMVLMDVAGDSMEPDIRDKDVVLIDQSQADVIAGAIFAVGIDEEVLVKYVDKEPGKYILRSANERYRPIEIDLRDESQNVRIIGRVVWWCREAR